MAGLITAVDISASGMRAETQRMEAISSNLANINSVASSPEDAFQAVLVNFKTLDMDDTSSAFKGVYVDEIKYSEAPAVPLYRPSHPLADEKGYVYGSNVSREDSVADLTSASQGYKANLGAIGLTNTLIDDTIKAMN